MPLPDPLTRHPLTRHPTGLEGHGLPEGDRRPSADRGRRLQLLRRLARPEHFVARCVRYHFDFIGDRLIIGKFVAIAQGAQFIMNGANHPMGGFSTFPFAMFGLGDPEALKQAGAGHRGDTVIGNDVWIGREAVIMPGVTRRRRRDHRHAGAGRARCAALCDRRRQSRTRREGRGSRPRSWRSCSTSAGGTGSPTRSRAISLSSPRLTSTRCAQPCRQGG
jgi:hypothetical protein